MNGSLVAKTRIQKSKRPNTVTTDDWRAMSEKERAIEIANAPAYNQRLDDARARRGVYKHILEEDPQE